MYNDSIILFDLHQTYRAKIIARLIRDLLQESVIGLYISNLGHPEEVRSVHP